MGSKEMIHWMSLFYGVMIGWGLRGLWGHRNG